MLSFVEIAVEGLPLAQGLSLVLQLLEVGLLEGLSDIGFLVFFSHGVVLGHKGFQAASPLTSQGELFGTN